jgi:RNA polymerase sigma-70 factor (ECF subfamily)
MASLPRFDSSQRSPLNPLVEDDRLSRARRGDLAAFNELVVEHQALVFNLCFRLMGQRQAAEDAVQEAFVSAWRNLVGLRGDAFRAWLLRIAANACKDALRRRGRQPATSLDTALEEGVPEPPDPGPAPEPSLLQGELRGRLEQALLTLPAEQRLAVVLCDVEGFDYVEIADVMKTSLGTVKSRIARGRSRLREVLLREPELLPDRFRPKV